MGRYLKMSSCQPRVACLSNNFLWIFGHGIVHDSRSTIIEELLLGWASFAFVSMTCCRSESRSAVRPEGVNLIALWWWDIAWSTSLYQENCKCFSYLFHKMSLSIFECILTSFTFIDVFSLCIYDVFNQFNILHLLLFMSIFQVTLHLYEWFRCLWCLSILNT